MDNELKRKLYKHLTKDELIGLLIQAEEERDMRIALPVQPIAPNPLTNPFTSPFTSPSSPWYVEPTITANNKTE